MSILSLLISTGFLMRCVLSSIFDALCAKLGTMSISNVSYVQDDSVDELETSEIHVLRLFPSKLMI